MIAVGRGRRSASTTPPPSAGGRERPRVDCWRDKPPPRRGSVPGDAAAAGVGEPMAISSVLQRYGGPDQAFLFPLPCHVWIVRRMQDAMMSQSSLVSINRAPEPQALHMKPY